MSVDLDRQIEAKESEYVERLNAFLRIPSISTASENAGDVRRACEVVRDALAAIGFRTTIEATERHPILIADSGPSDGPTLLLYAHYDVQPAGDLSLWKSPPFEPTIRDGAIFARGSADDKGQMMCHVFALEALKAATGRFPCRIKLLIEGEEEIGSASLAKLVPQRREALACDLVVLSDTAKLTAKIPAITYGTKGLVYKEVKLHGPKQNLHSGTFGGTIANPGNVLAKLVASMKDESGRVTIPGFYDDVLEISAQEKRELASLPFSDEEYLATLGSPKTDGEKGYSTVERKWVRPTLDVNGLYGGYMAEGASTVIPSMCGAKVSMRLVPNQTPEKVSRLFDEYVRRVCPDTVRFEILSYGMALPYLTPLDHPALAVAKAALEHAYGVRPAMIREGGTIPIMAMFKKELGAESVLIGFCDPHAGAHGPNEFFHVSDLVRGTKAAAKFLAEVPAALARR